MIDKFCESFYFKINEAKLEAIKPCIDNSFKTIDEYKFQNGVLRGLEISETLLKKLFHDVMNGISIHKEVRDEDITVKLYSS